MAVFKCKMCGAGLEVQENATVTECAYCGAMQTLPKLNDERLANLYDRASHFRRNNEFDKAMGIYEQILNEDNTDSEAYWSLVLCRYGIEYVEDPYSRKRIPTMNRTQYTSVFDDSNYKMALEYADSKQRAIYTEEANAINEIQKGILAISQKEEPFDVFICYKETDANGRRTYDSVLANDLYHQLTQEGFKVFFSRITLEDKLGTAYEPYIFAALNSAKVMVVIGTKPEYFQAVWVKNEWSRYLSLIKQGQKKMLVPAYRDMDPYDLPDEFSHLQAQDMNKLGFMQDLIRGIEKIIGAQAPKAEETVTGNVEPTITPLMKRAFIFMEDGEWAAADSYCEKVLDLDPENALAYLGKLMVELRVSTQEKLKNVEGSFARNGNFIKAVRYADNELKAKLMEYSKVIEDRENERLYQALIAKIGSARTQDEFLNIATELESAQLVNYKDSLNIAADCRIKANEAYKAYTYEKAINLMNLARYDEAKAYFENVKGYMDANEYAAKCIEEIEKLQRICMESYQAASLNAEKGKDYLSAGNFAAAYGAYQSAYETFTKLATYNDSADRASLCEFELKKLEIECNPTIEFKIPRSRNPLSLADGAHYYYTFIERNTRESKSFDVILAKGDTVQTERIKQGEYDVLLKVYGYSDTPGATSPMHQASCTISVKNFETIRIMANNPGLFSGVKITTQKD